MGICSTKCTNFYKENMRIINEKLRKLETLFDARARDDEAVSHVKVHKTDTITIQTNHDTRK